MHWLRVEFRLVYFIYLSRMTYKEHSFIQREEEIYLYQILLPAHFHSGVLTLCLCCSSASEWSENSPETSLLWVSLQSLSVSVSFFFLYPLVSVQFWSSFIKLGDKWVENISNVRRQAFASVCATPGECLSNRPHRCVFSLTLYAIASCLKTCLAVCVKTPWEHILLEADADVWLLCYYTPVLLFDTPQTITS